MYRSVIDSEGGPEDMSSSSESSESGCEEWVHQYPFFCRCLIMCDKILRAQRRIDCTYLCRQSRRNHSRRRRDRVVPGRAPHPRLLRAVPWFDRVSVAASFLGNICDEGKRNGEVRCGFCEGAGLCMYWLV